MAIVATDWAVDSSTKNITYIGDAHGGASPSYATVIQFHRFLQGLADDATWVGDDEISISETNPSKRSTDNIITLVNSYNIDATASEHLYDGSVIQNAGADIYDGIVNFGNASVQIQIQQDGAVLATDWWNFSGAGLNPDAAQGISHRFMLPVRVGGTDTDGRRLLGTTRAYGNTFSEFPINGTSRGNNVLALKDAVDLNNATLIATVAAISDVFIDRTISTTTVSGVNNTGQAVLNVVSGAVFTAGDFILIAGDDDEYQINSISVNALTLNHNLAIATVGAEALYDLNMGFTQIDVDNNAANEDYYAHWSKGVNSINTFYERLKWLSRDGTLEYVFGIGGELFRGITHEFTVDTPTGTFAPVEAVSWTGGTGQMLAVNSPTAATKMWIQLLSGVAPTDGLVITGGISTATVAINVTVTDRSALITTPFVGASTGSAIIGSYGLTLLTGDLSSADKVFDLTNTQITPPNNVTFTVSGLVATEDYVTVSPWDGTTTDVDGNPALNKSQMALNTALATDNITAVVIGHANGDVATIPSDTPSTGFVRVTDDKGLDRRLHYSSWTGTTFTIDTTDGNEDFLADEAAIGVNVYINYLDELIGAGTSLSYTGVYSVDRDVVVLVRDGGASPIKEFISSAVFGSANSTISAIRTSDA